MIESASAVADEYAALEQQLADPMVHADPMVLRKLTKRYAALAPTVAAYRTWLAAHADLEVARELAEEEDSFFASELPLMQQALAEAEDKLCKFLLPRDEDDDRDVIIEVKAGVGGEESALFAGDLVRMYLRYAERAGWRAEITDAMDSNLGGYTDVRLTIKAKGQMGPGTAPWARLKYEGGVHRVQRVPVTESQGRIHTSAAGVLLMPDLDDGDDEEITFGPNDLKIDVYRSSGPGGQSVNTTDSAVRITHLSTGAVVSCQNEKSQLQNKESALRVLKARLRQIARDERNAEALAARTSQVRTVDRSERIRTYNFPENRIADHRTGYKAYNLDAVLDGDLDPVVQSAVNADEAARMAVVAENVSQSVNDTRSLLMTAAGRLREAGVSSPESDATILLAHAWGIDVADVQRERLLGHAPGILVEEHFHTLIEKRVGRVPVQHLTGRAAFRNIEFSVGPGVFVPRPEAELLVDLVLAELGCRFKDVGIVTGEMRGPVVVDLCTGSGAIALALKSELPTTSVYSVEIEPMAFSWAQRNRDDLGLDVEIHCGAAESALPELEGVTDVVVSNPPYIPSGMVPVDPEVRDHDPEVALYGGSEDGLRIPLAIAARAAQLLYTGGLLVMEHADSQGVSLPAALGRTGAWSEIQDHRDLVGRPRATTARRRADPIA